MMKSDAEIKDIFHKFIKGSQLEQSVISTGGGLHKTIRPPNSKTEDILISVLDGINGQLQDGIVYVNIYVPDKNFDDYMIENEERIRELSRLAITLLDNVVFDTYHFEIEKQQCFKIKGVNEHCITNKINITIQNY